VLALHDRATSGSRSPVKQRAARTERTAAADEGLVCRACGQLITRHRHRIERQGSHQHRFMNPGGFLYRIGCFSEAIGCLAVGPPSWEYPWFAGFAWRCAECAGCRVLLGWHFRNQEGEGFFGLILDRLAAQRGAVPET
jgi:hypothetical protein